MFCIYLNGHLGELYFLAIANLLAAMNLNVHGSLQDADLESLG